MMAKILSGYSQWFFRVSAVLFFSVSLGTSVWVGCFYKVAGHCVSSSIQAVLLCWCFPGDISLFRSSSILGHFLLAISYLYLSLYLYDYPLLFSLYTHVWGFYNCHIRTLLQCPVLFSWIWLIIFTIKFFFPQNFDLLF